MERAIIIVTAWVFLLYGVGFIFVPEAILTFIFQTHINSSSLLIDIRATYGGMSLAVGLILLFLNQRRRARKYALMIILVLMCCMAFGRLIGFFINGDPNTSMYVYLALEVIVALVTLSLLLSGQKQPIKGRVK